MCHNSQIQFNLKFFIFVIPTLYLFASSSFIFKRYCNFFKDVSCICTGTLCLLERRGEERFCICKAWCAYLQTFGLIVTFWQLSNAIAVDIQYLWQRTADPFILCSLTTSVGIFTGHCVIAGNVLTCRVDRESV